MGWPRLDAAALMAPALFAAGLDIVLFTLPLHGRRTPRDSRFSGQLFANPDVTEINEAMGQPRRAARGLPRPLAARARAADGTRAHAARGRAR
jgi:hypothetical protein